tara:strand:+ start:14317 stop:15204 length:888 start_codon:yes stop_codon:yes gene_type:complete
MVNKEILQLLEGYADTLIASVTDSSNVKNLTRVLDECKKIEEQGVDLSGKFTPVYSQLKNSLERALVTSVIEDKEQRTVESVESQVDLLRYCREKLGGLEKAVKPILDSSLSSGTISENTYFKSIKECAEYLGASQNALNNWKNNGKIKLEKEESGYPLSQLEEIKKRVITHQGGRALLFDYPVFSKEYVIKKYHIEKEDVPMIFNKEILSPDKNITRKKGDYAQPVFFEKTLKSFEEKYVENPKLVGEEGLYFFQVIPHLRGTMNVDENGLISNIKNQSDKHFVLRKEGQCKDT